MPSVIKTDDNTMTPQASGNRSGGLKCVAPLENKDGSYTLPAPAAPGTGFFLVRTGKVQRQHSPNAEYTLQGMQITLATPLRSDEWIEFYYLPCPPITSTIEGGWPAPGSFQVIQ
jgi:hypothetical protein